ncbi:MAG: TetR/AcrR family transcriptional regulator [Rhodoglobus sp.]
MADRELKKAQTRRALANAAIQLFTELGYDDVTMADVAAEAKVSRRTAFRYFQSKDDLVMQHPTEWLVIFDDAIEVHRDRSLSERLTVATHAVTDHIEANPVAVRQLFALAFVHPSLAGRYALSSRQWIDRIAAEVFRDRGDEAESRMLAAAIMGIIDTVAEIWATTDQAMGPLLDRGLLLLTVPLMAPTLESLDLGGS